jgi:hypothetical protein
MDELPDLMYQVLDKLTDISLTLNDINAKLDSVSGVYGIDDVISKLDEVSADILGDTRYNLTDIFKEISELNDKS